MNIRIQVLIIMITIIALLYIVRKIKNKGIELKYSILWITLGIGILAFTLFPQLGDALAHILGISQPVNMLFFAGFCFLLPIIFSLSVAMSKMSNKIKSLVQEIALLREELDKNAKKLDEI